MGAKSKVSRVSVRLMRPPRSPRCIAGQISLASRRARTRLWRNLMRQASTYTGLSGRCLNPRRNLAKIKLTRVAVINLCASIKAKLPLQVFQDVYLILGARDKFSPKLSAQHSRYRVCDLMVAAVVPDVMRRL